MTNTMHAVQLTGHGGFEKLEYRTDIPVPTPGPQDVLIRVSACGINNTDINTRVGWYSKSVTTATNDGGSGGFDDADDDDGGWSGALAFPRIQGADCCGTIVAVGSEADAGRIGERVIVRTMQDVHDEGVPFACITYGSEMDGGFAQYAVAHQKEAYTVNADWSDAELASIPCAYSTAENMLHRIKLGVERVLITGASGGVGSAAVQLAKRRGAEVIALASAAKHDDVKALGADLVLDRNADLVSALGKESVDVVVDLVAGDGWPPLLDILKRGGRYATAGAIAGPLVELDVRTLYLKDLTFYGCTYQDEAAFRNLVSYIENNEIRPLVAKTYPLQDIVQAQQDFLAKQFTGKLVLIPPQD
ncbi:MAG: alcohol dehydrogenase family protein [Thiolinea sp.]